MYILFRPSQGASLVITKLMPAQAFLKSQLGSDPTTSYTVCAHRADNDDDDC